MEEDHRPLPAVPDRQAISLARAPLAPFRPDPTDLPHVDPSAAMLTAAMLAAAMQRGEIRTAFQPQVALATGALTGVEALSRWTDAAGGAIAPDRFIRVAEQAGLIGRLSQSVLRDSLAAAALPYPPADFTFPHPQIGEWPYPPYWLVAHGAWFAVPAAPCRPHAFRAGC